MNQDAELAVLRRRAYGPHADIADDPVALARLTELENRLDPKATRTAPPSEPRTVSAAPGASTPSSDAAAVPVAGDMPVSRALRRPVWHTAMVVAVAAVALLAGAAAVQAGGVTAVEASASSPPASESATGFAFASDPSSRILLRVPVNGARGQLLDLPDPEAGPDFPTELSLRWTQPLGEYYGWRLWIARDEDDNSCMLITADTTLGRCVTPDEQAEGALFLSVPHALVPADERPAGLSEDQSLGFWWVPDDTVLVLTGLTADVDRE